MDVLLSIMAGFNAGLFVSIVNKNEEGRLSSDYDNAGISF